jgi:hypothetical protein
MAWLTSLRDTRRSGEPKGTSIRGEGKRRFAAIASF